jgi:hypothetical protein
MADVVTYISRVRMYNLVHSELVRIRDLMVQATARKESTSRYTPYFTALLVERERLTQEAGEKAAQNVDQYYSYGAEDSSTLPANDTRGCIRIWHILKNQIAGRR